MATDAAVVVAVAGSAAGFGLVIAGRVRREPLVIVLGLLTVLFPLLALRYVSVPVIAVCSLVMVVGGVVRLWRGARRARGSADLPVQGGGGSASDQHR